MVVVLIWSLIAYGITSIINWGSIFEKPRNWIITRSDFFGDFITCTLCTSTWVGFLMSICFGGLCTMFFDIHWLPSIFFDGMFTAGVVWVINSLVEFFEENRFNNKSNDD